MFVYLYAIYVQVPMGTTEDVGSSEPGVQAIGGHSMWALETESLGSIVSAFNH